MSFPAIRMRRMRRDAFSRALMREHTLLPSDLIMVAFVIEGEGRREPVPSMPGVDRLSIDELLKLAGECMRLGIPALALFPSPGSAVKSEDAAEAWNPDNLMHRATRALKAKYPELGLIGDVALDPYTTHGQDGLIDEAGYVMNEPTVEALIKMSLAQAEAGMDFVAPSDMMDGRIGSIRRGLDARALSDVGIMAYSAKFASGFYGPFREAAESTPQFGDRRTYQMDPANGREAMREIEIDFEEGADILMVKPALSYLDIIRGARDNFPIPIAAYNVSGEYSMVKAAAERGWIDGPRVTNEILTSIKRAGADLIITYHAMEFAKTYKG